VDALADRLAYLADHPEQWAGMGRAGRKKIEEDYDREKLNRRLIEIYRETMPAGPGHG
jgi:colanic acid/amylovoran biosynthesis glycosyltransferase